MRNLKKFLALVLAFVMAMSLMVTVNAASSDFVDSEDINEKFVEAVEVLSGMGIFRGTEENGVLEFAPKASVTRAQMAAVVYRLATGDADDSRAHLYKDYQSFTDVSSDAWYAGYVGYCADAGIIVGDGEGAFYPSRPVSGYQALAMLLRAVGYGQNEEFEGSGWTVRVGQTATGEGLLKNVNTSSYANSSLGDTAVREMLAEVTFQAAQIPTVRYQYGVYNKYTTTVTVAGQTNILNPSLGLQNYGLTKHTGIVVGNQATGEDYTKVGFTVTPTIDSNGNLTDAKISDVITNAAYYTKSYTTDANVTNVTLAFDWTTGLEDFGNKVDIWYDCRTTGDYETVGAVATGTVNFNTNLPTYAVSNQATNIALVDGVTTLNMATAADSDHPEYIATAAKANGFKTSTTDTAIWNYAFGVTNATSVGANGASVPTNGDYTSTIKETGESSNTHPLYLLISNNNDKTVDMVISLDLTVTEIAQTNSTTTPFTVGVTAANGAAMSTNHYFGVAADKGTGSTDAYINLADDNIVGDSVKALGKHVVAIEITGTTGTNIGNTANNGNATAVTGGPTSTYYYQLSELTRVEKYTVVARDADETITLSDGTKLERSPLALATDGTFQAAAHVAAPTTYGEYYFTLDQDDKYIFWEPIPTGSTFVYGTYLDYYTDTATSEFVFPMVGVDLDGKMVERNVTAYSTFDATTTYNDLNDFATGGVYDNVVLPKKNAVGVMGQATPGMYVGYLIDEDGVLTYVNDTNGGDVKQATQTNFGAGAITLNASDNNVKLGAAKVYASGELYFTNETQFYLVSGAGTANQKVTPYNGLADLMKGNTSVVIDVSKVYTATTDHSVANRYLDTTTAGTAGSDTWEMVYYTESSFDYAQNYTSSAKQVDVVFIPEAFVKFTPSTTSSLAFIGESDATGLVNSGKEAAVQYTVYVNGEEQKVWIAGANTHTTYTDSSVGAIVDNGDNVFYGLKDTTKKAADGEPIYDVVAFTSTPKVIGLYYDGTGTAAEARFSTATEAPMFRATNYNRQLAFIDSTTNLGNSSANLYNVGSAFVKNLNTKGYPGITDVATLSNAASLVDDGAVTVSCVLNADDAQIVDIIYVNAP